MANWGNAVLTPFELRGQKREALLRQAALEFRKRGYHATSMDDIAAALGVTKGALYRYVKGKDEVLHHCFKQSEKIARAAIERALAGGGTGAEQLRVFVMEFVREYLDSNFAGGAMIEIDALLPHQREDVVAGRDGIDKALKEMVRKGVADGSISDGNRKFMILALMGSINWMPNWYSPRGELSSREIAEETANIFLNGMRPRADGETPTVNVARSRNHKMKARSNI